MIINGFSPINDNPLQEGMNGEAVNEGGDFSALLFLILATPVTQGPQVEDDAERSLTTVSSDGGSSAGLDDAKHPFIDASLTPANPHTDSPTLADASGQLPATVIALAPISILQPVAAPTTVEESSGDSYSATEKLLKQDPTTELQSESSSATFHSEGQGRKAVAPEALTATALPEVLAPGAKGPDEDSKGVWADVPPNTLPGVKIPVAEASLLNRSTIDKQEIITADVPKEMASSSQAAAARPDSARAAPKSDESVAQPSFEFLAKAGTAATDAEAAHPKGNAPSANAHIAEPSDPYQGRGIPLGYSIYAKDNPGQTISSTAREPVSPDDGGLKIGHQLQSQTENEPHGRVLSETIHGISETRAGNPNQGEQSSNFQHGEHEPSHGGTQVPVETAQQSGALFNVARLTGDAPSVAHGAAPAQWRPVVEQVAGEINGRIRIGETEAVIQLDPPELGKLKIDLHLEGDKLEARIFAETQESRTLIETHLPELRQALGENRLEHVDVRIDSGSWGSARGDGQQGPRQEASGGRQSANDFGGTARGGAEEPERRQPAAQEPGRVSMWA